MPNLLALFHGEVRIHHTLQRKTFGNRKNRFCLQQPARNIRVRLALGFVRLGTGRDEQLEKAVEVLLAKLPKK